MIWILLACLVLSAQNLWAQFDLSHEVTIASQAEISENGILDAAIVTGVEYRPTLLFSSADFYAELTTSASGRAQGDALLGFERLAVEWYPLPYLLMAGGNVAQPTSQLALFSRLRPTESVRFDRLLAGDFDRSFAPASVLQVAGFAGPARVALNVELLPGAVPTVDPSSRWFPTAGYPDSIDITFPSEETLVLRDVVIEEEELEPGAIAPSISIDAQFRFSQFELVALYYSGRQRSQLFSAELSFPNGLSEFFDLRLVQSVPDYRVFGIGGSVFLGSITAAAELAYSPDTSIAGSDVEFTSGFSTSINQYRRAEWGLAGTYATGFADTLLQLEYVDAFTWDDPGTLVQDSFDRLLLVSATRIASGGEVGGSLSAVAALSDWSWGVIAETYVSSMDETVRVSASLPLFFGAPESVFGQYQGIIAPAISLKLQG